MGEEGDWDGAGHNTSCSIEPMRKKGGYKVIVEASEKLNKKH